MRINSFRASENDNQSSQPIKSRGYQINTIKLRQARQQQRKNFQKRLFGQHYNHARVGLNKQKKYLLQQQKNTEIQRQNLILLEKIQKIAKRSAIVDARRRLITQVPERQTSQRQRETYSRRSYDAQQWQSQKESNKPNVPGFMSGRMAKRLLFSGQKEAYGRSYEIKSYVHQRTFYILIVLEKKIERISCELSAYKMFAKEKLNNNHSQILNFLKFNGRIFELIGFQDCQVQLQEQSTLVLPQIDQMKPSRHKITRELN